MEVNLQTSVITAGAAAGSAAATANGLVSRKNEASVSATASFHDALRQVSSNGQGTTGDGNTTRTDNGSQPSMSGDTAKQEGAQPTAGMVGAEKESTTEFQKGRANDGQNFATKTALENKKECESGKSKPGASAPSVAAMLVAAQVPVTVAPAVSKSGNELKLGGARDSSAAAEATTPPVNTPTTGTAAHAPVKARTTAAAGTESMNVVTADVLSASSSQADTGKQTAVKRPATVPGPVPKGAPAASATVVTATAVSDASFGDAQPARFDTSRGKTKNNTTKDSTQAGKTASDSVEATPSAPLATGIAADAVAGMSATDAFHYVKGTQVDGKQPARSRSASKPAANPANAEATVDAIRTPDKKVMEKNGLAPPSTTGVQAAGDTERTARQGSGGGLRDGNADSRSSNSDKGQTAKDQATEKMARGPNIATFAQAAKKDGGSGQDNSPNPASAAANIVGPTPGSASGAVTRAGNATTSPTAQFGSKSVATQRDVGIANIPRTSAVGADGSIWSPRNAQLIGKANQAEMRIYMDTGQLGRLELRTWATGNRISTMISTQRPETHWLLSNGVGTLHQALNDHNLQVERIDVVWNPGGYTGGHTGSSATGSGAEGNRQGTPLPWSETATAAVAGRATEETTTSSTALPYLEGRLSVRV